MHLECTKPIMNLESLDLYVVFGSAILGSCMGVLGGVLGTWCSIRNTQSSAERVFVIRCSIAILLLVIAFVAGLLLVPVPYYHLLWIPYAIALVVGVRWMNRAQARLREVNPA